MILNAVLVDLGVQVLRRSFYAWCERRLEKLIAYFDPDYWLFKDTELYRWPWPTADDITAIQFRIALNRVLASSEALQKSIDDWNNKMGAK